VSPYPIPECYLCSPPLTFSMLSRHARALKDAERNNRAYWRRLMRTSADLTTTGKRELVRFHA
jgi:hypothetical protein